MLSAFRQANSGRFGRHILATRAEQRRYGRRQHDRQQTRRPAWPGRTAAATSDRTRPASNRPSTTGPLTNHGSSAPPTTSAQPSQPRNRPSSTASVRRRSRAPARATGRAAGTARPSATAPARPAERRPVAGDRGQHRQRRPRRRTIAGTTITVRQPLAGKVDRAEHPPEHGQRNEQRQHGLRPERQRHHERGERRRPRRWPTTEGPSAARTADSGAGAVPADTSGSSHTPYGAAEPYGTDSRIDRHRQQRPTDRTGQPAP